MNALSQPASDAEPIQIGSPLPTSPSIGHAILPDLSVLVGGDSVTADEPKDQDKEVTNDPRLQGVRQQSTVKHQENDSGNPSRRPPIRPRLAQRRKSSRYSEMTAEYFEAIPVAYNVWASYFTWLLLAGFVVGPAATQNAKLLRSDMVDKIVSKVPLLVVSLVSSGTGGIGMCYLWYRWRTNYLWLVHKVFLPGLMNGCAGTLAAGVNIWAIQEGQWQWTPNTIITVSVTGGSTLICLILTIVYQALVVRAKRQHKLEGGPDLDGENTPSVKRDVSDYFVQTLTG